MDYSKEILSELKKKGIKIGDRIFVDKEGESHEGILMPKSQGAANFLIIKLSNGYNTGIEFSKGTRIRASKGKKETRPKVAKIEKYKPDASKPTVAILSTGGTVASRIDYNTGGVHPLETAEDIVSAIPELTNIINLKIRKVFQMWSEDMEAAHWIELVHKIDDEIRSGVDGIIITHGTDAMHYTSAALSLMIQDSPIPILLVGSQRSSDRGSSDAAINMICAAQFIAKSDFSGVSICMHGSPDDKFCLIHDSFQVKKTHTSRRDAFKSIDVMPYARVETDGAIQFLRSDYKKKDKKRKPRIVDRFDNRVALIKIYPGFDYRILDALEQYGYRGIILEAFALGHAPVNVTDDYTKNHATLLETIKRISKTMIIGMTSQCTYGKVNMNVYSCGRILQQAGAIPLFMTPETALVKMGWSLGHTKNMEDAKKILLTNIAGEIIDRIDVRAFE